MEQSITVSTCNSKGGFSTGNFENWAIGTRNVGTIYYCQHPQFKSPKYAPVICGHNLSPMFEIGLIVETNPFVPIIYVPACLLTNMQLVRDSIDSIQFEKYLPLFYIKNVWIRRNKFLVIGKMVDVQMVIQVVGKLGYQINPSFLKMVTRAGLLLEPAKKVQTNKLVWAIGDL